MDTLQATHPTRRHDSILAAPEKEFLCWLARRLPGWVHSDHLTLLGLAGMALAGAGFWAAGTEEHFLILVVIGLLVNWLGDSLDGTLARVRGQERPRYGFYVDHVIDMVGTLFLLGGLAVSGYATPLVAIGLLVAYLMISGEMYLAASVLGVFHLSCFRMGPTELRLLLIVGTLFLWHRPVVHLGEHGPLLLFDVGGTIAMGGIAVAWLSTTIRNARTLSRAEPADRHRT